MKYITSLLTFCLSLTLAHAQPTLANSDDIIAAKARANHTGTQAESTVTGLVAALESSDADALAFVSRCGGLPALNVTELAAVNRLTLSLKQSGLWSKLIAFYPFVGRAAIPCAQNLKSSSYALAFAVDANSKIYGWSFSNHGARGDGWGSFADTGFNQITGWPEFASGIRSGAVGVDLLKNGTSIYTSYVDFFGMGTGRNGSTNMMLFLRTTTSYWNQPGWMNNGSGQQSFSTPGSIVGTWINTYTTDPSTNSVALTHPDVTRTLYLNGTVQGTQQAAQWYPPLDGGGPYTQNGNIIFAGRESNYRGSGASSSDRPMSCAFISTGLTADDAANLTTIISQFRTDRKIVLPTSRIVGDGDSIMSAFTASYGGAPEGALRFLTQYPPYSDLLNDNLRNYAVGGLITGNCLSAYAAGPHTQAGLAGKYILWIGTNDLYQGASATTILANLRTLWTKAKQDGFSTVAFTVLKRSDFTAGSAKETQRLALNAAILADAGTYVDQVVDVDSVITSGMTTATYFGDSSSPYVHPNDAGHQLIWAYVAQQLK